jgi:hypothetical protein
LVGYEVPLRLVSYLSREDHFTPWRSFDISIGFIKKMMLSTGAHYGQLQVRFSSVCDLFIAPV